MSILELTPRGEAVALCQNGCRAGNLRKTARWRAWIMGRDAGWLCDRCGRQWTEAFENGGLAREETEAVA